MWEKGQDRTGRVRAGSLAVTDVCLWGGRTSTCRMGWLSVCLGTGCTLPPLGPRSALRQEEMRDPCSSQTLGVSDLTSLTLTSSGGGQKVTILRHCGPTLARPQRHKCYLTGPPDPDWPEFFSGNILKHSTNSIQGPALTRSNLIQTLDTSPLFSD